MNKKIRKVPDMTPQSPECSCYLCWKHVETVAVFSASRLHLGSDRMSLFHNLLME